MSDIFIREAKNDNEVSLFWNYLYAHFERDIFPNPEDEDREYFFGDEYRQAIEKSNNSDVDRCRYLFFLEEDTIIGFALVVFYDSEDNKCFLMEFAVLPEFRGNGKGTEVAKMFINWAEKNKATYIELNADGEKRRRFWERLGFKANGLDEWGMPLMMTVPKEEVPIHIEILADGEDFQLKKLENGYLDEIGEGVLSEERAERLSRAVDKRDITFFFAKRGFRAVGMVSIVKAFSTFNCNDIGVVEDFYIEPVFRGQGIGRMLVYSLIEWAKKEGIKSLTVTSSEVDEDMYRSLGFKLHLGNTYAYLIE